jgi:hypothetical protein
MEGVASRLSVLVSIISTVSIPACNYLAYSFLKLFIGTIFLFIRSAAPTPAALGATNGFSQTKAAFMRTIGPVCATSLYALSRRFQLLGGHLFNVVVPLMADLTVAVLPFLPEM